MTIALIVALALATILLVIHSAGKMDDVRMINRDLAEKKYKNAEDKQDLILWRTENLAFALIGTASGILNVVLIVLLIARRG